MLVLAAYVFFSISNFGSSDLHEPLASSTIGYELEDVYAEILSEGTVVYVRGKVRNLHHNPIRGKVIIYMADGGDGNRDIMEAEVNKRRPIPPGGSGFFEMYENVEEFELGSIENIYIEFIFYTP